MTIIKLIVTSHTKTHNLIYIYQQYMLCNRNVMENTSHCHLYPRGFSTAEMKMVLFLLLKTEGYTNNFHNHSGYTVGHNTPFKLPECSVPFTMCIRI